MIVLGSLFMGLLHTVWTVESVPRLFHLSALQGSGAPSYKLAAAALNRGLGK